jgi:hypothetical protein
MGVRTVAVAIAISLSLAACLEADVRRCESGLVCPGDSLCDEIHDGCITQDQLDQCEGRVDGELCTVAAGTGGCLDGVCLPAVCGDHMILGTEVCEPGLPVPDFTCQSFGSYEPEGLVCTETCTLDTRACGARCGDGVIDVAYGEACEDRPPSGACLDFGFDAGGLRCSACRPGFLACGQLGWRTTPLPMFDTITGVWASDAGNVWVAGGLGSISHFTTGTWVLDRDGTLGSPRLDAIWGADGILVAVGDGGTILHRIGDGWTAESVPTTTSLHDVWGVAADDVWAVGDETTVHWGGLAWIEHAAPVGIGALRGVHGAATDDVWAVGDAGTVLRWNGAQWDRVSGPAVVDLTDVWVARADDVWVTGPAIYHWDGVAWTTAFVHPDGGRMRAVWGAGADDVTAVGEGGVVAHWNGHDWAMQRQTGDLGDLFGADGRLYVGGEIPAPTAMLLTREHATWTEEKPPPSGPLHAVWGSAPDDVWLAADDGAVLHWDGVAWTSEVIASQLTTVWGSAPDDVWAGGFVDGLRHWNGDAWSPDAAITLAALWGTGPDDVWAVGGASAWHWDGVAWTPVADGGGGLVWGSGPDDIWTVGGFGHFRHWDGVAWTDATPGFYEVYAGLWGSAPDDVWAVTNSGKLQRFDGTEWIQGDNLLGAVQAMWGSAPDDVWVLGLDGAAWHFDGVSWSPIRQQVASSLDALWGDGGTMIGAGVDPTNASVGRAARITVHHRWACRAAEVACGDGVDDDCDDLVDADDADCTGGVVLEEVHGGAEPFIEVRNRAAIGASLAGLTLEWRLGCSNGTYRFGGGAIAPAGGVYRVVGDRTPRERERWSGELCDTTAASGWVMLCAGACAADCSNVLDVVEKSGTGSVAPPPACASMVDGALVSSSASDPMSIARTSYDTAGAHPSSTDWTVRAATRD